VYISQYARNTFFFNKFFSNFINAIKTNSFSCFKRNVFVCANCKSSKLHKSSGERAPKKDVERGFEPVQEQRTQRRSPRGRGRGTRPRLVIPSPSPPLLLWENLFGE
jgi:hypothetical protein